MRTKEILESVDGYQAIQQEINASHENGSEIAYRTGGVSKAVARIHPKRLRLEVTDIIDETDSTKTFRMVSANGYLPPFQAGQYISLFLTLDGVKTCRPYSISSTPGQRDYYDLTIKRMPNSFVSGYLLDNTNLGDQFESSGPDGFFYYNPLIHGNSLVMIAGGSGITPIMSMIRDITDNNRDIRLQLIYGSANPDDIVYFADLKQRETEHSNLSVTHVISDPPPDYEGHSGFITGELIQELTGNVSGKTFFLCGPEAMYKFCLSELVKLGVAKKRIRNEVFGPPSDVTCCSGWPENINADDTYQIESSNGAIFTARATEPILVAFERHRQPLPSACRTGQCSMCRIKILSGEVFEAPNSGHRVSDRRLNFVHACMTYPLSNLVISI